MKFLVPLLSLASMTLATATDLTVVSFNIRNGGRRMDGVYDHPLQIQVLKDLQPDVVAMQEVDHFTKRSGGINIAGDYARALGMTSHFAAAMPYGGGAYGAAVLSKFPAVEDESINLPVKDGEPRVCVLRFLQVPGVGIVAFAGVHLDSGDTDAARLENAKLIIARLQRVKEPVVIAGDFNDQPDSATLKLFAAAGFHRLIPQGDPNSFPADQPKTTIDHILTKDSERATIQDLGTRVPPIANASDHRPLQSHLRITLKP